MSRADHIHVAAAVIFNENRQVLISLRPESVHQGGLWEFPGGKVEESESLEQALARELEEELGITPSSTRPLIRIYHDYKDRAVLLDVWRVERFLGEATGREGQKIEWVDVDELADRSMPAADRPIIRSILLPDRYLITPEPTASYQVFLKDLSASLRSGIRLVQLRAHTLSDNDYVDLAKEAIALCHASGAKILLNRTPDIFAETEADGLHLNSHQLMACSQRPLDSEHLVSASCHNPRELEQANRLQLDFIVAGPVKQTLTHPGAVPIGWDQFYELCEQASMPVYALGGMRSADLDMSFSHGGQGIAAIRSLWRDDS